MQNTGNANAIDEQAMCGLNHHNNGGRSEALQQHWSTGPVHMQVHSSSVHTASVNAISFAPHELGLALAAASSDGSISVLTHTADAGWHTEKASAEEFETCDRFGRQKQDI